MDQTGERPYDKILKTCPGLPPSYLRQCMVELVVKVSRCVERGWSSSSLLQQLDILASFVWARPRVVLPATQQGVQDVRRVECASDLRAQRDTCAVCSVTSGLGIHVLRKKEAGCTLPTTIGGGRLPQRMPWQHSAFKSRPHHLHTQKKCVPDLQRRPPRKRAGRSPQKLEEL